MIYHILNGDMLKQQFPSSLSGEQIVARECLVDGPVQADDLHDLFQIRSGFISEFYGDYTEGDYEKDTVSQFETILNLPADAEVVLWFEDDLFCQVNFWFVCYLLVSKGHHGRVFLVRPQEHTRYGFGGFATEELLDLFEHRVDITASIHQIADLWSAYQSGNTRSLMESADGLKESYPFIKLAVQAQLDRLPAEGKAGRPEETLQSIIDEIGVGDFGRVFQKFCERESIYGFGDLQVRKMFDRLTGEKQG